MAAVDHIRALTWEAADFAPLGLAGRVVGRLRRDHAMALAGHRDLGSVDGGFTVTAEGLDRLGDALRALGRVGARRGEAYAVREGFTGPDLATIDRSAAIALGVRSTGVHLNGVVERPDGPWLWIARRARDKATYPGQLDNMVAGGIAAGLGPFETLVKECGEEAGVPGDLAARAVPRGGVTYVAALEGGLRRDLLYVYDLDLPGDFTPRPVDGEVEAFELMPIAEVARLVETTTAFKFNVNLVLLDLLVRRGVIGPEHPDYVEILAGLRMPVV